MDLDIDVQRLRLLESQLSVRQKYALEDKIAKYLPQEIRQHEQSIAGYEADMAHLAENTCPDADGFSPMVIENKGYTTKKAAGSAILEACQAMTSPDPIPLGAYRGFGMVMRFDSISREYRVTLSNKMSYTVSLGTDLYGNIARLDNALAGIEGPARRPPVRSWRTPNSSLPPPRSGSTARSRRRTSCRHQVRPAGRAEHRPQPGQAGQ